MDIIHRKLGKMYICELAFDLPDPGDPAYSLNEPDYYAWIPLGKQLKVPNHRLSLRKNLVTGKFEIYRAYVGTYMAQVNDRREKGFVITHKETGAEEVIFSGGFEEALGFGNQEYEFMHGSRDPDLPCRHVWPEVSIFCPRRYKEEKNNEESS